MTAWGYHRGQVADAMIEAHTTTVMRWLSRLAQVNWQGAVQ